MKNEQRIVIKFLVNSGEKPAVILRKLPRVFGNDCLSQTRVHEWAVRFASGWESVQDDTKSGATKIVHTMQNVEVWECWCGPIDVSQSVCCKMNSVLIKKPFARWYTTICQCTTSVQRLFRKCWCGSKIFAIIDLLGFFWTNSEWRAWLDEFDNHGRLKLCVSVWFGDSSTKQTVGWRLGRASHKNPDVSNPN